MMTMIILWILQERTKFPTKTASNEDDKAESWDHEVATCDKS